MRKKSEHCIPTVKTQVKATDSQGSLFVQIVSHCSLQYQNDIICMTCLYRHLGKDGDRTEVVWSLWF